MRRAGGARSHRRRPHAVHSHAATLFPAKPPIPQLRSGISARSRMNMMNTPHGCRLRRARCSMPGRLYMLTTVTHQRRPLFHNLRYARLTIHNLRHAEQRHHCQSLAWVVMPDHVHWLIELKDATLSTLMQRFKCQSSNALRKAGAKGSPIWQAGFYDRALRRDEDVRKAARYIIANPIRAGLVTKVGDYPHWDAVWL